MIDLKSLPIADNHVHPYTPESAALPIEEILGHASFTDLVRNSVREPFLPAEMLDPLVRKLNRATLSGRYLLRELAQFLGTEESWDAIGRAREAAVARGGYRVHAELLFRDVNLDVLLMEEGGVTPRVTLEQFAAVAPVRLRRVMRVDNLLRDLLRVGDGFDGILQQYRDAIDNAVDEGVVAMKSVIAYRTGLDVEPVSCSEAQRNFDSARHGTLPEQKPLRDFFFSLALEMAMERGIPFHLHVGVGDPDIVYKAANPAQLYPLLHSERFRPATVVLIHGGWPWTSEAAAMAGVLPNVYLDLSEGTLFGMSNLDQRLMEVLEFCPYSKILYGSDGCLPETLWISARRFKKVLSRVLEKLVTDGFLSPAEAQEAGGMILYGNAARLYGL